MFFPILQSISIYRYQRGFLKSGDKTRGFYELVKSGQRPEASTDFFHDYGSKSINITEGNLNKRILLKQREDNKRHKNMKALKTPLGQIQVFIGPEMALPCRHFRRVTSSAGFLR